MKKGNNGDDLPVAPQCAGDRGAVEMFRMGVYFPELLSVA